VNDAIDWHGLRWLLSFNGIADRRLHGFDADGWRLRHGEPANGLLALLAVALVRDDAS
jgi:hypothetical protein